MRYYPPVCRTAPGIQILTCPSSTAFDRSNWKWPNISGLHDFKGTLLHSANYDTTANLAGKRVAVIGSGSSGIQIVPTLQPSVTKLGAYLRSSTWIVPPFGAQYIKKDERGEPIYAYTDEERDTFGKDPEALLDYRRMLEKDVSHRCSSTKHKKGPRVRSCTRSIQRAKFAYSNSHPFRIISPISPALYERSPFSSSFKANFDQVYARSPGQEA